MIAGRQSVSLPLPLQGLEELCFIWEGDLSHPPGVQKNALTNSFAFCHVFKGEKPTDI